MQYLLPFTEEIRLGVVEDPHTHKQVILTERVTLCPFCWSFHSLRRDHGRVYCEVCAWSMKCDEQRKHTA